MSIYPQHTPPHPLFPPPTHVPLYRTTPHTTIHTHSWLAISAIHSYDFVVCFRTIAKIKVIAQPQQPTNTHSFSGPLIISTRRVLSPRYTSSNSTSNAHTSNTIPTRLHCGIGYSFHIPWPNPHLQKPHPPTSSNPPTFAHTQLHTHFPQLLMFAYTHTHTHTAPSKHHRQEQAHLGRIPQQQQFLYQKQITPKPTSKRPKTLFSLPHPSLSINSHHNTTRPSPPRLLFPHNDLGYGYGYRWPLLPSPSSAITPSIQSDHPQIHF